MEYQELIARALQGRKVLPVAKAWGVPQKTLDRYVNGERVPDFHTTIKIIEESGVPADEVVRIIAAHEQLRKNGGPPVSRTRHQRIMRHMHDMSYSYMPLLHNKNSIYH